MAGVGASVASLLGCGMAALVISGAISGQVGGAGHGTAGAGLSVGAAFVVAGLVGCLAGCLAGCLVILAAKAAHLLRGGQGDPEVAAALAPAGPARPALAFAGVRRRGAVP